MTTDVDGAVAAIRAGRLAVIPTDTVYGLACEPSRPEPVERLAQVKGRTPDQPISLVAASLGVLLESLPDMRERDIAVAQELLPGPYTLVLPNPERRFPWLAGSRMETIGVRVPDVEGVAASVLRELAAVAATSANLHGGRDPRRVDDVPREIREAAAVLDGGELPGTPSTVLDLTGPEPIVLREGLASGAEAIARLRGLFAE